MLNKLLAIIGIGLTTFFMFDSTAILSKVLTINPSTLLAITLIILLIIIGASLDIHQRKIKIANKIKNEQKNINIFFLDHAFEFTNLNDKFLHGYIFLDKTTKRFIEELIEFEERNRNITASSPTDLFEKSPWSYESPNGRIKMLLKHLDLETGEAIFINRGEQWEKSPSALGGIASKIIGGAIAGIIRG